MLSHLAQAQHHYSSSPRLLSLEEGIYQRNCYFFDLSRDVQGLLLDISKMLFSKHCVLRFFQVRVVRPLFFFEYFYSRNLYDPTILFYEAHHRVPTKNPSHVIHTWNMLT